MKNIPDYPGSKIGTTPAASWLEEYGNLSSVNVGLYVWYSDRSLDEKVSDRR